MRAGWMRPSWRSFSRVSRAISRLSNLRSQSAGSNTSTPRGCSGRHRDRTSGPRGCGAIRRDATRRFGGSGANPSDQLEEAKKRQGAEDERADASSKRKGVLDAEVREYRSAAANLAEVEAQERAKAADEESERCADDVTARALVPRLVRREQLDTEIHGTRSAGLSQSSSTGTLRQRRDKASWTPSGLLAAEVVIQREVIREAGDEVKARNVTVDELDQQARQARDEAFTAKAARTAVEREVELQAIAATLPFGTARLPGERAKQSSGCQPISSVRNRIVESVSDDSDRERHRPTDRARKATSPPPSPLCAPNGRPMRACRNGHGGQWRLSEDATIRALAESGDARSRVRRLDPG